MIQKGLILLLAVIAIVLIILSQFSFMPISILNVAVKDVNTPTTAAPSLTSNPGFTVSNLSYSLYTEPMPISKLDVQVDDVNSPTAASTSTLHR